MSATMMAVATTSDTAEPPESGLRHAELAASVAATSVCTLRASPFLIVQTDPGQFKKGQWRRAGIPVWLYDTSISPMALNPKRPCATHNQDTIACSEEGFPGWGEFPGELTSPQRFAS